MVVLKTARPADSFPITGFEGEPNRFDEDAKGLTNVGETGDPAMKPGTSKMLTIDMAEGHYAIVCNLNRSEERRVGKECRVRWSGESSIKKALCETEPT